MSARFGQSFYSATDFIGVSAQWAAGAHRLRRGELRGRAPLRPKSLTQNGTRRSSPSTQSLTSIRSRRLETAELFAQGFELLSLFGHGAPLGCNLVVKGAQVQVEVTTARRSHSSALTL
jgi:hypothetical protein